MGELARLSDRKISRFLGVFYKEDDESEPQPESAVLLLDDGTSVAFTSATDWTLRIEGGTWPTLPDWCYPADAWEFRDLHGLPEPAELGPCREAVPRSDEVGEVTSVLLWFPHSEVIIRSGDAVTVEFRAH